MRTSSQQRAWALRIPGWAESERSAAIVRGTCGQYVAVCSVSNSPPTHNPFATLSRIKCERYIFSKEVCSFVIIVDYVSACICISIVVSRLYNIFIFGAKASHAHHGIVSSLNRWSKKTAEERIRNRMQHFEDVRDAIRKIEKKKEKKKEQRKMQKLESVSRSSNCSSRQWKPAPAEGFGSSGTPVEEASRMRKKCCYSRRNLGSICCSLFSLHSPLTHNLFATLSNKMWEAYFLKKCVHSHYCWLSYWPNPSARAGYDTRSIFKRSLTGLNSEFSF